MDRGSKVWRGFWRRACAIVNRSGVPYSDVPDVAQDAIASLLVTLATQPGAMPGVLLGVVVARQVAHWHAAAARRAEPAPPHVVERTAADVPDLELALVELERARALAAILGEVAEAPRAVFVAHELEGEPIAAVAERLGIPQGTAWNRLRLARAELRAVARVWVARGELAP